MSVFQNHVEGLTKCLVIGICEQYIMEIINITNKCAFAYRVCRTQVHILYSGTVLAESASVWQAQSTMFTVLCY